MRSKEKEKALHSERVMSRFDLKILANKLGNNFSENENNDLVRMNDIREINYDSPRGGVSVITEKGDNTVSYLLVQRAKDSDSGKYTCNPSNANPKTLIVHVLNVFYGIIEEENEDQVKIESTVLNIIKSKMLTTIEKEDIEVARRIGRDNNGKRPVLLKLLRYKVKENILRNGKKLMNTGYSLTAFLSQSDLENKKKLRPYQILAQQQGKKSFIKSDKLIINGKNYTIEDCEKLFRKTIPLETHVDAPDRGNSSGSSRGTTKNWLIFAINSPSDCFKKFSVRISIRDHALHCGSNAWFSNHTYLFAAHFITNFIEEEG
ncbi:unnamed protein product [Phaedon cochleariae]|uniref:Uncharacterized protein n=1 Tax=Phaedon cochleariae TaxID=80249 RepID=A0A9N9S7G3_PHACE|nr:unnamed protein product [Phaedon cochleariae]